MNLLRRVLDIYCQIDSSQCLAQLTPARVGKARSVHVQLGASPHVIRWDIVCLSPQSHTSVWESFHIFIIARQRPFCTLNRFKLLQVDQGSSVPLAKCSFGMIPLSRHSVDRSPRAFHSSTHNVVRASCFEVLSASVESRKLFLDVSLWQGVGHGVGVSGHLLGGSDLRWRQPYGVYGEGLSPPVHTSRVINEWMIFLKCYFMFSLPVMIHFHFRFHQVLLHSTSFVVYRFDVVSM